MNFDPGLNELKFGFAKFAFEQFSIWNGNNGFVILIFDIAFPVSLDAQTIERFALPKSLLQSFDRINLKESSDKFPCDVELG